MQYFKSIGGMITHMLSEAGEKTDLGKPITASEKPMSETEYAEFRKNEIKNSYNQYFGLENYSFFCPLKTCQRPAGENKENKNG